VSEANLLSTQYSVLSTLNSVLREKGEREVSKLSQTLLVLLKCKRLNNLSKVNKLNLRVGKGRYKEWLLSPLPSTEFKVKKLDSKGKVIKDE
jgi:hypothetical protein